MQNDFDVTGGMLSPPHHSRQELVQPLSPICMYCQTTVAKIIYILHCLEFGQSGINPMLFLHKKDEIIYSNIQCI